MLTSSQIAPTFTEQKKSLDSISKSFQNIETSGLARKANAVELLEIMESNKSTQKGSPYDLENNKIRICFSSDTAEENLHESIHTFKRENGLALGLVSLLNLNFESTDQLYAKVEQNLLKSKSKYTDFIGCGKGILGCLGNIAFSPILIPLNCCILSHKNKEIQKITKEVYTEIPQDTVKDADILKDNEGNSISPLALAIKIIESRYQTQDSSSLSWDNLDKHLELVDGNFQLSEKAKNDTLLIQIIKENKEDFQKIVNTIDPITEKLPLKDFCDFSPKTAQEKFLKPYNGGISPSVVTSLHTLLKLYLSII